jgi:hypothetical protein
MSEIRYKVTLDALKKQPARRSTIEREAKISVLRELERQVNGEAYAATIEAGLTTGVPAGIFEVERVTAERIRRIYGARRERIARMILELEALQ